MTYFKFEQNLKIVFLKLKTELNPNESPFCPAMAKNRGFMPTNKRVAHQPETKKKASVDKVLDLIPFFLTLLV
jgi:hypothetical protein